MDLEKDFNYQTLDLQPDYEGKVVATFISCKFNLTHQENVLYLHGYTDYFYHPHLAEQFKNNRFNFYALDLRKYGRSIRPGQHKNFCKSIEEYFEEISLAITLIIKQNKNAIYLLGHSTGGLIFSSYMNSGALKNKVSGLILNSPFLDFNLTKPKKFLSLVAAKALSKIFVYSHISGVLSPVYPQSLHKRFYGEWDFDLNWKPIEGFPTYFTWISAIHRAQKQLRHSNIEVPILIIHASHSIRTSNFSERVMNSDIVLNVEDIKRVGKSLGNKVTFSQINGALHDVFLSAKPYRSQAFNAMFKWLNQIRKQSRADFSQSKFIRPSHEEV